MAKKRGFFLTLFLIISFAASAFAGYGFSKWMNNPLSKFDDNTPVEKIKAEKFNILLLGADQRGNERGRSDTIMVANIDLEKSKVKILSIPRDTKYPIPGHGEEKINHSHAYGGPELTMEVVSDLLGETIDKYVEVNFEGFSNIIDTIGGVEIDVDKRMYYPAENINLKAGMQKLKGKDALGYVRYRHDLLGDEARIERQQKFIKAVAEQSMNWRNVIKIPQLIGDIENCLDTNISNADLVKIGLKLKKIDPSKIETLTLPGEGKYIGKVSYFIIDRVKAPEVIDYFTGKTETLAKEEN